MSTGYTIVNGNIVWDKKYTFKDGSPRPKCINTGCENPVTCSKGNELSAPSERSLRTVCSHCHEASYGKVRKSGKIVKLANGVTQFKKAYCENFDGHIVEPACTATGLDSAQLELDHIDGNHINNTQGNVQTLCKNCHSKKSIQSGDFRKLCKSHTSTTPIIRPQSPTCVMNLSN